MSKLLICVGLPAIIIHILAACLVYVVVIVFVVIVVLAVIVGIVVMCC